MEAPQRFLLNGIQGQAGDLAIVQRNNGSVPTGPGPAKTSLSLGQIAVVKTQLADHVCRTTSNRSRVYFSSDTATGVKRGSLAQAEIAFCTISQATFSVVGLVVPMQPRS